MRRRRALRLLDRRMTLILPTWRVFRDEGLDLLRWMFGRAWIFSFDCTYFDTRDGISATVLVEHGKLHSVA